MKTDELKTSCRQQSTLIRGEFPMERDHGLRDLQYAREQMEFHFRLSVKDFESNFHLFANMLQRNSEKQPH